MKSFPRAVICCLFTLASNFCIAQHGAIGAWNIASFKLNLTRHWNVFEESQLRSQFFYNNFSYYEIKGGAGYSFKKMAAAIGFGRFITYSDGDDFKKPYVNKEWRLWEQFLVNSYIGRVKFENRVRVEQRWTSSLGYRNRLKYRLNSIVPLKKKITPGTFYLSGWDEIYLTDSDPHFETNRIYAGAGYQLSKSVTLQSGFLSIVSYKPDDTHSGKNYLQFTVLVDGNAHKQHREKTPSSAD